ncbi:MAG: efflux RND transporter periplasmic adaptor subunit [Rhodothermales bacterium]
MNVPSFLKGLGILAIGVIGLILFIVMRPDPATEEPAEFAPVVEFLTAEPTSDAVYLQATGSVAARRDVALAAEVPGTVVWTHPSFAAGGAFRAGDVLIRLDSTDFRNAVVMAEAELTQRTFEALLAAEEAEIARADWERLVARNADVEAPEDTELGSLLFREPQLKLAEAARRAAQARLEDARKRLSRSVIRAPFEGRIRQANVNLGSYVAPGMVVATYFSTDVAEISVPVSARDVALFDNLDGLVRDRAPATVRSGAAEWPARVVRTSGAINPQTRMMDIVLSVDRPYATTPPLRVGTFVDVAIPARTPDAWYRLPVELLREDGTVWLFEDGTLRIRSVQVLTEQDGHAVVTGGLSPGDRIIRTNLAVVTDGMSVRTTDSASTPNTEN